jgi:hypothetical protein
MSHSDPLLRALADRDPHCPDGQALVRLGEFVREHSALPNPTHDLSDDVVARLRDDAADAERAKADNAEITEDIDAYYNGNSNANSRGQKISQLSDGACDRLAHLVRSVAPQRVDLTAAVMRRISMSSRFGALAESRNNRDGGLDGRGRWRIWSAVIAGHAAALLALAIFQLGYYTGTQRDSTTPYAVAPDRDNNADNMSPAQSDGENTAVFVAGQRKVAQAPAIPTDLPPAWSDIRALGSDLFLLRRFPELRDSARTLYGMKESAPAVARGISFIRSQLQLDGQFQQASGENVSTEHALATHCLATLVLLGEGLGDKSVSSDARKALNYLRVRVDELHMAEMTDDHALRHVSQVTSGLMCLTLVEGSLLYGDNELRRAAEESLQHIDRGLPMQAGAAGLGGFSLLALETAGQAGMRVPGRLLQQARRSIARSLPTTDDDAGRVGLAAFARSIYGFGANDSTTTQINQLRRLIPGTTAGRADPLGWFFATLAMREASHDDWQLWSDALQKVLIPLIDEQGAVSAQHIRYGETGGTVFATSLVLLNLQVPYRYLPLAAATQP